MSVLETAIGAITPAGDRSLLSAHFRVNIAQTAPTGQT